MVRHQKGGENMTQTNRAKVIPLNPEESHALRTCVYDLSPSARLQALYGIIQVLSFEPKVTRIVFQEIINDAVKYSKNKEGG
jgi:hypothetical protein